jgi:FtsX-like permease family
MRAPNCATGPKLPNSRFFTISTTYSALSIGARRRSLAHCPIAKIWPPRHALHERTVECQNKIGARHCEVIRLVLREGLGVTLFGVALGLVAALGLSRVMAGYVYGIKATDPVTFAGAFLLLILVALAACYIPARRATRVDPIAALRYE